MVFVADVTNHRQEEPKLDLISAFENNTPPTGWRQVFNRNCNKVVLVGGESIISMVTIRGAVYEAASHQIDEIRISGIRCPIHTMKVVTKTGNKTIVDITFALDPTNIIKSENGQYSMDIRFPIGFSPLGFISTGCDFQYIAATFKPLGLVALDITPVSFNLLWGMADSCTVIITHGEEKIVLENQFHKLEIENMDPSTTYHVQISTASSTFDLNVTTEELTRDNMRKYISSKKDTTGTIDLSVLDPKYTKFIRMSNILEVGQIVRIKGELDNEKYIYTARIVSPGETLDIDTESNNIYIVPDFNGDDEQFFCLSSDGLNHIVNFDKSETFVKYQNKTYNHGDKFVISNRFVIVAKGSIILVIGDDIPADFPYDNATALQVLTSGDLVIKDVIMRSSSQVVEKVSGATTWGISSFFVYDGLTSTTLETSRISSGLNDIKDTGEIKFSVLYTDTIGDQSLIDTLNSSPSETTIRSKTDTADTIATFNSEGLSFDTSEGSIYFGSAKNFRIKFIEEDGLTPSMLAMQSLDGGSYITRFLITSDPV